MGSDCLTQCTIPVGAESRCAGNTVQTGQLHRVILFLQMVSVHLVAFVRFQFLEFIWCPLNKSELLVFMVFHNQKLLQLHCLCENLSFGFESDLLLASFGASWFSLFQTDIIDPFYLLQLKTLSTSTLFILEHFCVLIQKFQLMQLFIMWQMVLGFSLLPSLEHVELYILSEGWDKSHIKDAVTVQVVKKCSLFYSQFLFK